MAKKSVVAHLKKRDKKKPMAYVDGRGNVVHWAPKGRKKGKKHHSILEKKVVSKDLLKARRACKIVLYVKGKKVMKVKSALSKRGCGRKMRRRGRGRK